MADRLFKRRHFRPKNKALAGEHFVELGADRLSEGAILFAEIEQGNTHCRCNHGSFTCTINSKFRPVLLSVHLGAQGSSATIDLHQPLSYDREDGIDPR